MFTSTFLQPHEYTPGVVHCAQAQAGRRGLRQVAVGARTDRQKPK